MNYKYNKVAIKIGSNVLTHKDGTLDTERMASLVDQIAKLHNDGIEMVIISSGAVAAGRSELQLQNKLDSVSARQVFSAVGQARLVKRYYELFREHDLFCGQVLTTKENFSSRSHYLNQKNCITEMLDNGVIPIVNENDTISVTELMFTDNDELSGLIASMMDMQALIILSNIDGIYNGDPSSPDSKVIKEVLPDKDLSQYIQTAKSSFGRGGMTTKCNIARKVAGEGIEVVIANGKKDGIIPSLLLQGSTQLCTRFVPNKKETSSVKKWIANSEGFAKGKIHLNQCATDILNSGKVVSILPVGITKIEGDFKKDDIVRLIGCNGEQMGVGRAQYGSEKAKLVIGQKRQRPFVHYDYLYLDNLHSLLF